MAPWHQGCRARWAGRLAGGQARQAAAAAAAHRGGGVCAAVIWKVFSLLHAPIAAAAGALAAGAPRNAATPRSSPPPARRPARISALDSPHSPAAHPSPPAPSASTGCFDRLPRLEPRWSRTLGCGTRGREREGRQCPSPCRPVAAVGCTHSPAAARSTPMWPPCRTGMHALLSALQP